MGWEEVWDVVAFVFSKLLLWLIAEPWRWTPQRDW